MPYVCETAGVIGHVSGPPFTELGSSDMKSTATLPGGKPVAGTAGHVVACGARLRDAPELRRVVRLARRA